MNTIKRQKDRILKDELPRSVGAQYATGDQMVKNLPKLRETRFDPWVGKMPWRRKWQPTPVLLPGKFHGWRSLVGYSPWGCKGADMTERLHFHFSLSCIGEGNGNSLQWSCLENPREGGAWWATVHGVSKSQTGLSDYTFTFKNSMAFPQNFLK